MKQTKYYRYLGTNGFIETPIELPGVYHTSFVRLEADENKELTNGELVVSSILISEKEVENWTEIDKTQE